MSPRIRTTAPRTLPSGSSIPVGGAPTWVHRVPHIGDLCILLVGSSLILSQAQGHIDSSIFFLAPANPGAEEHIIPGAKEFENPRTQEPKSPGTQEPGLVVLLGAAEPHRACLGPRHVALGKYYNLESLRPGRGGEAQCALQVEHGW